MLADRTGAGLVRRQVADQTLARLQNNLIGFWTDALTVIFEIRCSSE
jgi:hypothetical protein